MVVTVFLNILAQFIFFLVNFAIFGLILEKVYGYYFVHQEQYKELPKWAKFILGFFLNIFYPLIAIVRYIILAITFNDRLMRSKGKAVLSNSDKRKMPPIESEDILFTYFHCEQPIWHVHRYIGVYAFWLFPTIVSVLLIGLSLKFLLPETFVYVKNGIELWSDLVNQEINLDTAQNAVGILYDTFWNGLIVGGRQESIFGLLIFIFLSVFGFSQIMGKFFSDYWRCIPTVLTLMIGFNVIFAIVNYQQYLIVSAVINSFGMFALLAFLFVSVCCFIGMFPDKIIQFIIEKLILKKS